MSDWLHELPIIWMAPLVFGVTYLVAAAIQAVVTFLAVGDRARSFKAVSPSILPPLGAIFGLFVAFTAFQVWNDNDRANAAVSREASALRAVVNLAASFPGEPEARLRALVHRYIEEIATREWPMMARHSATLRLAPRPLVEALQLTLAQPTGTHGQQTAQREIAVALENSRLSRELRRSEAFLARANRLSSLGMLAAGIAHEIRNPLTAVKTFLDLLPQRIDDKEFLGQFRDLSLAELKRVTDLIAELLTLGKSTNVTRSDVDLIATIEPVVRLMDSTARKRQVIMTNRSRLGRWLKLIAPGMVDRITRKAIISGK